jgi:hypothetical protein
MIMMSIKCRSERRSIRAIIAGVILLSLLGCEDDPTRVQGPDLSAFHYIDMEAFRLTSPDTTLELNIRTMIIRRPNFKCGTFSIEYDSTLREQIPTCTPFEGCGDSICPTYYDYFLVDSMWFNGSTTEKFSHRIDLNSITLADTTIVGLGYPQAGANVSEPPIPELEALLNKPIYAAISLTKRHHWSPHTQNPSILTYGDIHGFWME